jgi:glycosidase
MDRKKRPSKTIEVLEKRAEGAESGDGAKGAPRHPVLYQINTRVWLADLSGQLGRPATLDDISDEQLDGLKRLGFDWIYLLGIWQTGAAGREVSRSNPEWRVEYEALLSDLKEDDICGSCFAVTEYAVHEALGGDKALRRLRDRLHKRGMRVMLDFVPNHTAPDHPWTHEHPDFYIGGTEADLAREPQNYMAADAPDGRRILAYGRDPYFAGWPDTLQLNYGNPALQEAMRGELLKVGKLCDGLRCDMAMLVLPEVFGRTWGIETEPFWPEAIRRVREEKPEFVFMAEVYWDMEWTLQQQGFDYTYDKRLYDRLRDRQARSVREHFRADADYQNKSARFLENHDEPRAAAMFPDGVHQAAALLTYLCPGLRFFHHGQLGGWDQKIPIHLCRGPDQPNDSTIQEFYRQLLDFLSLPVVRDGSWQLLDCRAASDGNSTADDMIAFAWQGSDGAHSLVVVNYAPQPGQCYVRLPFADLGGQQIRLEGRLGTPGYEREGNSLIAEGLYVDLPAWGYHVFGIAFIPAPGSGV